MADGLDAAAIIAEATHEAIDAAMSPVLKRLAELEAKMAAPQPRSVTSAMISRENVLILTMSDGTLAELGVVVGKDGADVDMAAVGQAVRDEVAKAVAPMLEAKGGSQAEPVTEAFVAPIIEKAVERVVAALPKPQDGKSVDPGTVKAMVAEAVWEAMSALPPAKDGQSVTLDDVRPVIEAAVKEAAAALPKPENGKDADGGEMLGVLREELKEMVGGIDLTSVVKTAVDAAVTVIPPAKDGVGLAGAIIDREGSLVITLTNGEAKNLGIVVGKDGKDVDQGGIERAIADAVSKIEVKDGQDGINWDDLTIEQDDARSVIFKYQRGERSKSFTVSFPAVIYRGVFEQDGTYAKGDLVTWDGCLWHCNVDETKTRPIGGAAAWTLAVKKGRDGKDFDRVAAPKDPRIKS
jgi:hypothetical protein